MSSSAFFRKEIFHKIYVDLGIRCSTNLVFPTVLAFCIKSNVDFILSDNCKWDGKETTFNTEVYGLEIYFPGWPTTQGKLKSTRWRNKTDQRTFYNLHVPGTREKKITHQVGMLFQSFFKYKVYHIFTIILIS